MADPILPDGSSFFVGTLPLPSDHWIYSGGTGTALNTPPIPYPLGTGPFRNQVAEKIREAAKYAIRASTMNGKDPDFDPDAMVQNMIVGLIGYWTPTGYGDESWMNPPDHNTQRETKS